MKKLIVLLLPLLLVFSSCELVEGIFKAGMGFGIFLVIAVIALVIYLFTRIGKNK